MLKSLLAVVAAAASFTGVAAKTHEFEWTVGWVNVNPDGMKERLVVGFNNEWPLPVIRVNKGDRIVATVHNDLQDPPRNSSIHWHGLFQNGTNDMDGPSWITQCPHAPNSTFVYNFTVDQNGTYWYHAHVDNLYPDGYRQILLVDNDEPAFDYDEEIFFTLADWYHELTQDIADDTFMSLYNPTGAEPVPQYLLFNSTANNASIKVEPNTTYRLRIANTGAFSAYVFYIQGHNVSIVEADGVYCEPQEVGAVHIAAAQRYSLLFTTGPEQDASYQMVYLADSSLYDVVPPDLQLNHTNWLVTSDSAPRDLVTIDDMKNSGLIDDDSVEAADLTSDNFIYYDDSLLVPVDREPLLQNPTKQVNITVSLTNLLDGKNYAFFNDISWTHAKVPTLYTVLDAPEELVTNETIYGDNTHTVVLEHNEVVELILNNFDGGQHPFHLHGHHFQVAIRADAAGDTDEDFSPYLPDSDEEMHDPPMRRDVLVVKPYSHFVIRWRADNPGVWFFHCHIDWHLTQGLAMEFVEAPLQIRQNIKVPKSSFDACAASNLPFTGNAAAHTENYLDMSGANVQVKDLPGGFTARGIVALVFSCVCAFVGMGFLVWYGISDTPEGEAHTAERFLDEPVPEDDIQSEQFNHHTNAAPAQQQ